MDRKVGIFKRVDYGDKQGFIAKAFSAAKYIKILSALGLSVILIAVLVIAVSYDGSNNSALVVFLITVLIALLFQILLYWYANKIKNDLENEILPHLGLSWLLLVLSIIATLKTAIGSNYNLVGFVVNLFMSYLWYVVINCVSKARKIEQREQIEAEVLDKYGIDNE